MRRRRTLATAGGAALAAFTLAACSVIPAAPSAVPDEWVPSIAPPAIPSAEANSPLGFTPQERAAVRVRNNGCDAFATGSGFILDSHTIVTNRHVVEDSGVLEVTLSDGTDVTVTSSVYATNLDFALLTIEEELVPTVILADHEPRSGNPISIIGYPEGDALVVSEGLVDHKTTDEIDHGEDVYATTAEAAPGSSGSAVYSSEGEVVGVLYAGNDETNTSLIIPVGLLRDFLDDPSTHADNTPACTLDWH